MYTHDTVDIARCLSSFISRKSVSAVGRDAASVFRSAFCARADAGTGIRIAWAEGEVEGIAPIILPAPGVAASEGKAASQASEATQVHVLCRWSIGIFALFSGGIAVT